MSRVTMSAKALLLGSSIGVAAVAWAGSATAAVPTSSGNSSPNTVVIRGSSETTPSTPAGNDPPPVVLRGSRPLPGVPPADYACPAGYFYDPSAGCIVPGYANEAYDYDDWPYWGWGLDGFDFRNRQHRFPHSFGRRAGRGPTVRFGHPAVNRFGPGFAHVGGFGRR